MLRSRARQCDLSAEADLPNLPGIPPSPINKTPDFLPGIPFNTDFVDHPSFGKPQTEEELFGTGSAQLDVPRWTHFPEVPEDVDIRRRGRTALSTEDEVKLFLRYNYSRYRLCKLAEAQQRRFSKVRAREMNRWYSRAQQARSDLVGANMALVLAMAKRTRIPNVEFAELVSEGNMALLRSVEKS